MIKKSIIKPEHFEFENEKLTNKYGTFWAEPFERGFATTIGNSLRRVMFAALNGTAVIAVKIEGVLHEFSTIPGVVEDVTDIILNIKQLKVKLFSDERKSIFLSANKEGEVHASDIKTDPTVEILNPELLIATLDKNANLSIEFIVDWGIGYSPAEEHQEEEGDIDLIYIDAAFSPIDKVNFWVKNTRVGRSTEFERLYLEIFTDGSISPQEAVAKSSEILKEHYLVFLDEGKLLKKSGNSKPNKSSSFNENLLRPVDELELSVRSYNCLKKANIETIAQLVQRTETQMLETRNFGRKSLNEIKDILVNMDLHFGMNLDNVPLPPEITTINDYNENDEND